MPFQAPFARVCKRSDKPSSYCKTVQTASFPIRFCRLLKVHIHHVTRGNNLHVIPQLRVARCITCAISGQNMHSMLYATCFPARIPAAISNSRGLGLARVLEGLLVAVVLLVIIIRLLLSLQKKSSPGLGQKACE